MRIIIEIEIKMIANNSAAKQPFCCSAFPPKDGPRAAGISMETALRLPQGARGAPTAGQDPKRAGEMGFPSQRAARAPAPSKAQCQPRWARAELALPLVVALVHGCHTCPALWLTTATAPPVHPRALMSAAASFIPIFKWLILSPHWLNIK